ncbi:MAG TPA: ubiquinol-cytochrome C chaperone family protein [Caulobacteraceae bacterium]|nr:ubiquinol-cytochrome C chaperone family protein [Caulobacteraceae bacterium]
MILDRLLAKRPAKAAGARLNIAATQQARAPAPYLTMNVPDTIEGRFELLTLHVVLLVERLKGEGTLGGEVSQALFDAYLRDLDGALREMGVGDLSVGKKMRRLGEAFYGRAKGYAAAFAALPDRGPLADVLARTVTDGADATALAAYADACRRTLAGQSFEALLAGEVRWPEA